MTGTKTSAPPATPVTNGERCPGWPPGYEDLLPDLDKLVTEDGAPVDNYYVEKLYRLLVDPLYDSWTPPGEPGRPFVASANVGWFHTTGEPPLVPDMMLSLDVVQIDSTTREGRSYFQWLLGKPPELVIEVVSDARGDEPGEKLRRYQRQRLQFYVIHDPLGVYNEGVLRAFRLNGMTYEAIDPRWIPELDLGLVMWQGTYQGETREWLRWCDRNGEILLTGGEANTRSRAEADHARDEADHARDEADHARDEADHARSEADRARSEADRARSEADRARSEADRLREQLRKLGIDPEA